MKVLMNLKNADLLGKKAWTIRTGIIDLTKTIRPKRKAHAMISIT